MAFPQLASKQLKLIQLEGIWQVVKILTELDKYKSQLLQRGGKTNMPSGNRQENRKGRKPGPPENGPVKNGWTSPTRRTIRKVRSNVQNKCAREKIIANARLFCPY